MHDVAIVGAGELGGNLAHVLAARNVVRSIRLIDSAGSVATGKALDIMQASPIQRFSTHVSGVTDVSYAAGATIVVVADRAEKGEWQGEEAVLLLEQISRLSHSAIVLCAGASHRELVERGVREHRYSAQRLFGSAPEAFAAALRSLIALEANGSVRDVALTILGVPPQETVIPWLTVTIAGFAALDALSEPVRRRIEMRLGALWPPGPYALATAAAEAVSSIASDSRRSVSCFVAPAGTAERRLRAAALPVRLGPEGATRLELPELDPRARVALDTALRA
jgi:malate dehydrogenase